MRPFLPSALAIFLTATLPLDAARACRVTPPVPSIGELQRVPLNGYAFSGIIEEVLWSRGVPAHGIPHDGFSLKIRVTKSFAKPVQGTVVVQYGGCDFAPAPGETINVIAENSVRGLRAVHYANYFKHAQR
jgi:hypothetical protein